MRLLIPVLALFFLLGCNPNGSSSASLQVTTQPDVNATSSNERYTGESYINSIPGDTTPVSDLVTITTPPHILPLLTILIEYDDQTINSADTVWAQKIFGYTEHDLNAYYDEVSGGQFHFTQAQENYGTVNDGVIKVHLNKNRPDTDINAPNFQTTISTEIKSALQQADIYIDFSKYDNNNDGAIEEYELAILLVMAGDEDAYSGYHTPYGIWAHQSALDATVAPTLDGVTLCNATQGGKYAIFGERHSDASGSHDATVGIMAHELGHAIFNLPDLYNTEGSSGGIGYFGLMGAGMWTQKDGSEYPGDTPVHLSAWSKSFIGWVAPQELHNTATTLYESASRSYNVIKIPISANHYYLLENRNDSGFDRGLRMLDGTFKGGVLIWHINQKKLTTPYFQNNNVNADTADKGVDVVEANDPVLDLHTSDGNAKALFYRQNRSSFGSKVTNISDPGDIMFLDIN